MSQAWSIVVVGIEGCNFYVKVATTENDFLKTTVKQLKQKIYNIKQDVEPDEMRILYAGQQLEELDKSTGKEYTLQDYKVRRGSAVTVVIRCHGGGAIEEPPVQWSFPDSDTTFTKPHVQVSVSANTGTSTHVKASNDSLRDVHIGSKKTFLIRGDHPQILNWDECGLRISFPQGALSQTATSVCEVAITALVGGQFKLPFATELISAIYFISVSKPLLKPVKLEIQHCARIITQDETKYLSFATGTADQPVLPYQLQEETGGLFYPGHKYGSIYLSHFCFKAIIKQKLYAIRETWFPRRSQTYVRIVPENEYVGQVVYEVIQHDSEWLMRFMAAKHLNVLLEYIKKSFSSAVMDTSITYTFQSPDGFIELVIDERSVNGWSVYPHKYPTRIYQSEIDRFGAENPPCYPSLLITISVQYDPDTAKNYRSIVSLKGIEPQDMKICIIRSLSGKPRVNYDTVSCVVVSKDVDIPRLKGIINKVLNENYAKLKDLSQLNLERLASEMFSANLIREVKPSFKYIIGEFQAAMHFMTTCSQLENHCVKFLAVFDKLGGNFERAAIVLRKEWMVMSENKLKL